MKKILILSLVIGLSNLANANDAAISVQIISQDKVISSTIVGVGECYTDTNKDSHTGSYQISFPLSTREKGQTWLESRGEIIQGSFATFDRIITKDYTRNIPWNGSSMGTTFQQRQNNCREVRNSYLANKELAEQLFKSPTN